MVLTGSETADGKSPTQGPSPSQYEALGNPWDTQSTDGATGASSPLQRDQSFPPPKIIRKEVPGSLLPAGGRGHGPSPSVGSVDPASPVESATMDAVPAILKPAGGRTETNPFLRKKVQTTSAAGSGRSSMDPPNTDALKLDNDHTSIPFDRTQYDDHVGQLLRHETGASLSDDRLLPLEDVSPETNPWVSISTAPTTAPPPPPQYPPPTPSPDLISVDSDEEQNSPNKGKGNEARRPTLERADSDDWNMIDSDPEDEDQPGSPQKTGKTSPVKRLEAASTTNLTKEPASDLIPVIEQPAAQPVRLESDNFWETTGEEVPTSASSKKIEEAASSPTDLLAPLPTESIRASNTTLSQEEDRPPLPPRGNDRPKWTPTRAPVDGESETYQIKSIRWHDYKSSKNPRTSPILVQNENGPCPLVALVNALTLTTPADAREAALVNVLKSREQISLNLLLSAVFDELMSPARLDSQTSLPDVGDLYAFLQSLHTGMNVNPRFIPSPEMVNAYKNSTLTHLDISERTLLIPGTFENTAEMSLYATFSIPLIHGWLPQHDDPICDSLERQGASYEDVQNLLFREEELDEKLSSDSGLTELEQDLYHDLITIKDFLGSSATQLTSWGIEVIGRAMRPGSFAILFRNDHFGTLYCHPDSHQLLSLVTDAGYKSHDEIVWESLSDVNGLQSQFLSGDFRPIGADTSGEGAAKGQTSFQGGRKWNSMLDQTGDKHSSNNAPMRGSGGGMQGAGPSASASNDTRTTSEQEDRDLALAMQLQEEEDRRLREQEQRQRRERELSEQYIEQQARVERPGSMRAESRVAGGTNLRSSGNSTNSSNPRGNPTAAGRSATSLSQPGSQRNVPGRRSSHNITVPVNNNAPTSSSLETSTGNEVRPNLPPRGDEPPPPSYEQAQNDVAFNPPPSHPSYATPRQNQGASRNQVANGGRLMGVAQGASLLSSGSGMSGQQQSGGGRMASVPSGQRNGSGNRPPQDRDCVIM